MREHIRLQQEYGNLVRAGKHDDARKLMLKVKGRVQPSVIETVGTSEPEIKVPVVEEKQPIVEEKVEDTLDDLVRIKGIGNKTVKDIKVMFKDIKALKIALKEKRVALRDDIVKKLEEELI